jgi:hypothetical protein
VTGLATAAILGVSFRRYRRSANCPSPSLHSAPGARANVRRCCHALRVDLSAAARDETTTAPYGQVQLVTLAVETADFNGILCHQRLQGTLQKTTCGLPPYPASSRSLPTPWDRPLVLAASVSASSLSILVGEMTSAQAPKRGVEALRDYVKVAVVALAAAMVSNTRPSRFLRQTTKSRAGTYSSSSRSDSCIRAASP